jgi:hypothetical protein
LLGPGPRRIRVGAVIVLMGGSYWSRCSWSRGRCALRVRGGTREAGFVKRQSVRPRPSGASRVPRPESRRRCAEPGTRLELCASHQ